jgi:ABC-type enterochelin transport system substrate-binding protein
MSSSETESQKEPSDSESSNKNKKTTKAKAVSKTVSKTKTTTLSKEPQTVSTAGQHVINSIDELTTKGIAQADITRLKESGYQSV